MKARKLVTRRVPVRLGAPRGQDQGQIHFHGPLESSWQQDYIVRLIDGKPDGSLQGGFGHHLW